MDPVIEAIFVMILKKAGASQRDRGELNFIPNITLPA